MINTRHIKNANIAMYAIMIIVTSFGESVTFWGIKSSWLCAGVLLSFNIIYIICADGIVFEKRPQYKLILFFALFWLFYMFFQVLWVEDIVLWKAGLFSNVVNVFLILEAWLLLRDLDDIKIMLFFSLPLWALNIGLGLYEIITNNHFIYEGVIYWDRDMVRTFFGNPNDSATWITFCFLYLEFFLNRYNKPRILSIFSWFITTVVVYNTGSRACFFGMILYLGFYYLFRVVAMFDKKTNKVLKYVFCMLVIFVLLILFYCLFSGTLVSLVKSFSGQGHEKSDMYRIEIMLDTFEVIVNSAFMGAGAWQSIHYVGINPHNFLLEILADYGIVVFGILCVFIWEIIKSIFDKGCNEKMRAFYCACLVAFVISSISSSSTNRLRLTWVLLMMLFLSTDKLLIEKNKH